MNYTIYPKPLSGVINAPSSKSIMHRVLICASFATGTSIIENPLYCYDTLSTMSALEEIGVTFKKADDKLLVIPPKTYTIPSKAIECGNSGSTIRFLMTLYACLFKSVVFKGDERLLERIETEDITEIPFEYYITKNSITVSNVREINNLTLHTKNTSQLISGILLLIGIVKRKGKLHIISNENELDPYVELTLDVMSNFGVKYEITHHENLYTISINKHLNNIHHEFSKAYLKPSHYYIEGDYSSSAFTLSLGLTGDNVIVKNLYQTSKQGDKAFINIVEEMNGQFQIGIDAIRSLKSNLIGTSIDLTFNPDLGPVLMGLASVARGITKITNFERLELKESNRITKTIEILTKLGADITLVDKEIIINGKPNLKGGVVIDPYNDHRLAMMVVSLTSKYLERVTILNAECVNKSYPNFWEDYRKLNGIVVDANLDELSGDYNE